jgi:hypothetical protein
MHLFNFKEPMTVDELVGKLLVIDDLRNTSEQQNQEEIAMYTQDNSLGNTNLRLMKIEQTEQKERRNSNSSVTNAMSPVTKLWSAHRKLQKGGTGKEKGKCKKRAGAMMSVAAERPIVVAAVIM